MTAAPPFPLSLRSYGAAGALHQHAHVQIVLPMQGQMEIEVGGRGNRLDLGRAAFVAPDVAHAQSAQGTNRFLILDCAREEIDAAALERLQRQTFVPVSQPLRRLIEFIDLRCQGAALPLTVAQHCAPLLLDALLSSMPANSMDRCHGRLASLLMQVEAMPQLPWTTADMAQCLHLSVSRLHALFRSELQQTPQQWLSAMRLRRVLQALTASDQALAELALDHGYADQSTMTRALRRATGMTPAAYRRQQRR